MPLLVSDDGRGVFDKIQESHALGNPALAMLAPGKGQAHQPARTPQRARPVFTSRLAYVFDLHANAADFQRLVGEAFGRDSGGWKAGRPMTRRGTSAYFGLALDTPCMMDAVLKAHSLDGHGFAFERTVVPSRLVASDLAGLEPRAQARRVALRLNQFRHAEVDFKGITHIGHSFADELFRVLAPQATGVGMPRATPERTTARTAAFMPGASPPLVSIATRRMPIAPA